MRALSRLDLHPSAPHLPRYTTDFVCFVRDLSRARPRLQLGLEAARAAAAGGYWPAHGGHAAWMDAGAGAFFWPDGEDGWGPEYDEMAWELGWEGGGNEQEEFWEVGSDEDDDEDGLGWAGDTCEAAVFDEEEEEMQQAGEGEGAGEGAGKSSEEEGEEGKRYSSEEEGYGSMSSG